MRDVALKRRLTRQITQHYEYISEDITLQLSCLHNISRFENRDLRYWLRDL